jgi:hypothetical protein
MRLHQIKKCLLHIKENYYQNEMTTHRMGKKFGKLFIRIQNMQKAQKLNTKRTHSLIIKWQLNRQFSKEVQMANIGRTVHHF